MKNLSALFVLFEIMNAATALAAQPKNPPSLKCQDPLDEARQLLIEPQADGQVSLTYVDADHKASWDSQAQAVQNSPLAQVYRYESDLAQGSPDEVVVSLHHLATANPFCGRAGCDPVPVPAPAPAPTSTPHPIPTPIPFPTPFPGPHGPHRHAPLSDFGISAEIKLSGQSMILDCQKQQ
jgi:hypothetical protein